MDARCTVAIVFIAMYGGSAQVIRWLQMVLNAAAGLVVGASKFQHITPVLRDKLHWLPVHQQILYKVAVTAFDCVRGTGLAYFRDNCVPVADISGRAQLRLAERCDVMVPWTRTWFSQQASMLQPPSSGTCCLCTCAQPPSVVNNSEMGWRPISSHRPTPSSENCCLRAYTTLTHTRTHTC